MANKLFKIDWNEEKYDIDIKNVNINNNDTSISINLQTNDKENMVINIEVDHNNYSLEIPIDDLFDIFCKFQFIENSIYDNCLTKNLFTVIVKDLYKTITNSSENLLFYVYINDNGDYSLKVMNPIKNTKAYMNTIIDIPGLVKEYIQEEVNNEEEVGEIREFSSYLAERLADTFAEIINKQSDVYDAYLIEYYIHRHLIIEDYIMFKINELILEENKKGE